MKIVWIILGAYQNWTRFRGLFLCRLVSFINVNIQNQDIFLSCKDSNIILGVLDIPDILFFFFARGEGGGVNSKFKKQTQLIRVRQDKGQGNFLLLLFFFLFFYLFLKTKILTGIPDIGPDKSDLNI